MAKIQVGDVVIPNGRHLFKDMLTVSKTVKDIGYYKSQKIIRFNEGADTNLYFKADDYSNDKTEIAKRQAALERVKYKLFKPDYDESIHYSSKTGEPKIGHDTVEGCLEATWHMSNRLGGEWVYYLCPICNKYHTGKYEEET